MSVTVTSTRLYNPFITITEDNFKKIHIGILTAFIGDQPRIWYAMSHLNLIKLLAVVIFKYVFLKIILLVVSSFEMSSCCNCKYMFVYQIHLIQLHLVVARAEHKDSSRVVKEEFFEY